MQKLANCSQVICCLSALLIAAGLCGCDSAAEKSVQVELMVSTAQSLKRPMTEIARSYEVQNPRVKVNLNCAGSSSLVAQIIAGAPADVLASASRQDMDTLIARGLVDADTLKIFAANEVVLVIPAGKAAGLKRFEDLALDNVKRIAVGNPRLTPAGLYAEEVLAYFGIKDQVKDRLIYCDQVAQVCDYTARGEADAGIVYLTDYLARQDQLALAAQAPAGSHKPVEYPAAVVKQSPNKLAAGRFIALLCSEQGRGILSANGFPPVNEVNK